MFQVLQNELSRISIDIYRDRMAYITELHMCAFTLGIFSDTAGTLYRNLTKQQCSIQGIPVYECPLLINGAVAYVTSDGVMKFIDFKGVTNANA